MSIQIGIISYTRPTSPIMHEDIKHIININGKDIIRIAWKALSPRASGYIDRDHLASWFCDLFNLKHSCGQGNACINQLTSTGLFRCGSDACVPSFEL